MPSNGNAATQAFSHADYAYGRQASAERVNASGGNQRAAADPVSSLDDVLSATPVDLCRIADVMKDSPEFETMVMRLATSLLVSPEDSAATIEQAVMALGTERLRALLHIWSRFRDRKVRDDADFRNADKGSRNTRISPALNRGRTSEAESLYLATFLRDLATDTSTPSIASVAAQLLASSSQSIEFGDLSILFRDSVSPVPQAGASGSERESVASRVMSGSSGKEYE